jgi:hypothetical protein
MPVNEQVAAIPARRTPEPYTAQNVREARGKGRENLLRSARGRCNTVTNGTVASVLARHPNAIMLNGLV